MHFFSFFFSQNISSNISRWRSYNGINIKPHDNIDSAIPIFQALSRQESDRAPDASLGDSRREIGGKAVESRVLRIERTVFKLIKSCGGATVRNTHTHRSLMTIAVIPVFA